MTPNQNQLAQRIRRAVADWIIQQKEITISSGILYDILRSVGIKQNTEDVLSRIHEIVPELKIIDELHYGKDVIRIYVFLWTDIDDVTRRALQLVSRALNTMFDREAKREVMAHIIYHAINSSDEVYDGYIDWYISKLRKLYITE